MIKIEEILKNFKKSREEAAPHERAYWVGLTAKKLKKSFKQILGTTKSWPIKWIKDLYLYCEKSDNFGRLWWGLIKKSKNVHNK